MAELEKMAIEAPTPERVCQKLAQILRVQRNEVALLRREQGSLRFIYPTELRAAGAIPLSSSAVAARTASTRIPLLSNSFSSVKHVSFFETVKLADGEQRSDQLPIQKIISVPVADEKGSILGVAQVSRKGLDPTLSGTDFTGDDLKQLERAAEIISRMAFMQENAAIG